ncbi:hypothetical protein ACQPYH_20025 [Kribbella sp. CA-245084]|uniref:hypothetical protein n=1 Tax=Kribbella sp. CA-245084 TaxID=3239940 RepID=UPI003D8B6E7D
MDSDEPLRDPYGTSLGDLASAERLFRRRGLPAFALGYDRRYPQQARQLLVACSVASLAIFIPVAIFASQYFRWMLALQFIFLCIQAFALHLSRQRPESVDTNHFLGRTKDRSWKARAFRLLIPGAVSLFITGIVLVQSRYTAIFGGFAVTIAFASATMLFMMGVGSGISLLIHLVRRLGQGFMSSSGIAAREMPLLFPSLLIVFVTDDAWRLFGRIEGLRYWIVLGLLLLVASLVLLVRTRSERKAILEIASHADADREATVKGSPLGRSVANGLDRYEATLPIVVRRNTHLMLMSTAVLRVSLVGLATTAALIVFGVFVADARATASLLEVDIGDLRPLYEDDLFGASIMVTEPLVRLTGVLGALAALYFSISVPQSSHREFGESLTFLRDELDEAADTVLLYTYYLSAHLGSARQSPPPPRESDDRGA